MVVKALAGETLDAIVWRVLGRTRDVTEQALAMNPGLAALGPKLPEGTKVTVPEISKTAPPTRETIQLWN